MMLAPVFTIPELAPAATLAGLLGPLATLGVLAAVVVLAVVIGGLVSEARDAAAIDRMRARRAAPTATTSPVVRLERRAA